MTELQILNAVSNNGGSIGYTELLNQGLSDSVFDPLTDRAVIRALHRSGALSGDLEAYGIISISDDGRLALRQLQTEASIRAENIRREQAQEQQKFEQITADKAERKAEKRAERAFQIFLSFLQAFLSFAVGLLAEHFFGILDLLLTFFA